MAAHLSIGPIRFVSLAVFLMALVGLAVVAGAVRVPIHPGPEVETVPGPGSAGVALRRSGDGRSAAEARADSRVATKAGHDPQLTGLPGRAPAAGRIPKAGSGDQPGLNPNQPAAPRPAASEPAPPQGRTAVVRRPLEPRVPAEPPAEPPEDGRAGIGGRR